MDAPKPRNELRDFLSTRRARLQPVDVGLRDFGGSRRVPGLRREEIALLAGVSVDYYVRLEQGRTRNVSASVLDAVARALQLDSAERQHLDHLARPVPRPPERARQHQPLRPALRSLLQTLDRQPAFVIGDRMDVLAMNDLAKELMGDFQEKPDNENNLARFIFLDPVARTLHADWDTVIEETAGMLRLYAGRHPDDPELSRLLGDLTLRSEEFVTAWSAHDVRSRSFGTKTYVHPRIGEITLSYEALELPDDSDQRLCIYSAEPGSSADEALRQLVTMRSPTQVVDSRHVGGLTDLGSA